MKASHRVGSVKRTASSVFVSVETTEAVARGCRAGQSLRCVQIALGRKFEEVNPTLRFLHFRRESADDEKTVQRHGAAEGCHGSSQDQAQEARERKESSLETKMLRSRPQSPPHS